MKKMKKRKGMYPEQFYLLERGDIIRGVNSKSIRKVLAIKKYFGETHWVELLKLHPSWTRSANTLYGANEASLFVPIKVKNPKIWELTYEVVLKQRQKHLEHYHKTLLRQMKRRLKRFEV